MAAQPELDSVANSKQNQLGKNSCRSRALSPVAAGPRQTVSIYAFRGGVGRCCAPQTRWVCRHWGSAAAGSRQPNGWAVGGCVPSRHPTEPGRRLCSDAGGIAATLHKHMSSKTPTGFSGRRVIHRQMSTVFERDTYSQARSGRGGLGGGPNHPH